MSELPSISIVTPVYNSEKVLGGCLQSIRDQDYPEEKIEIIIVDGGSTDGTLDVAKDFNVDKVVPNPLTTGEAGKAVGLEAAENEIVAFVDSDNLLDGKNWLRRMTEPFNDPGIVASEPLYYTWRRQDSVITRYSALLGMNDPLCLYLGNYDRYCYLTEKWTGLRIKGEDRDKYVVFDLDLKNIPTIGANGFLVRREEVLKTHYSPYLFDIDVVCELVEKGLNRFAKVKIGIVHLFAGNITTFVNKQRRRIKDYRFYKSRKMRRYPWSGFRRIKIVKFIICTLLVFPILIDSVRGYRKVRDSAWFFNILACPITLGIYTVETFKSMVKPELADRGMK